MEHSNIKRSNMKRSNTLILPSDSLDGWKHCACQSPLVQGCLDQIGALCQLDNFQTPYYLLDVQPNSEVLTSEVSFVHANISPDRVFGYGWGWSGQSSNCIGTQSVQN